MAASFRRRCPWLALWTWDDPPLEAASRDPDRDEPPRWGGPEPWRHSGGHPLRRDGDPTSRGERAPAQAIGRHRRPSDLVAHHEGLRALRFPAVRALPWLQE